MTSNEAAIRRAYQVAEDKGPLALPSGTVQPTG
jgi:hypothetical protein